MTEPPATSAASRADDSYHSEYERIADRQQAAALLRRLMQARELLAITIDGHPSQVFTSALLEIEPEQGVIVLDELREPGHALLSEARSGRVSGRVQGVEVTFSTRLLDTQGDQGYRVRFPEVVNYLQRRQSYRVQLGVLSAAPVHLELPERGTVEGKLYDISSGGTCILATQDTVERLSAGQQIPRCTITLPDGDTLTVALEIRHVRAGGSGRFLVGGRFLALDPREQKRVERVVAMLERDARKRRSKTV